MLEWEGVADEELGLFESGGDGGVEGDRHRQRRR